MKAKHVIYSRLISKGNYENEKIEVCIEVEKGEKLKMFSQPPNKIT